MTPTLNPYDELPYRTYPIEWTAPERLALASLWHGGPRPPLRGYRFLELGCGAGANLLALAHYRRHASFVGVDGAASQIAVAESRRVALGLTNLAFVHADFSTAARHLAAEFDFIVAHGVFSWVSQGARTALFELAASRLRPGGLIYLNYNTQPGWHIRGLIREFLLAQIAGGQGLHARAVLAREASAKAAAALENVDHVYSQLMASEFRFVRDGDLSWIGHEFLAEHNVPYWRSDFLAMAATHGLAYVADADFSYPSRRAPPGLATRLEQEGLIGRSPGDTVDLLCYRQLHSPILTPRPFRARLPEPAEFATLFVASCLEAQDKTSVFLHPSGYEVEAKQAYMADALGRLQPLWPTGQRVSDVFPDVAAAVDDLRLLHQSGLIDLRCIEPDPVEGAPLHALERQWGSYATNPYHQVERTV